MKPEEQRIAIAEACGYTIGCKNANGLWDVLKNGKFRTCFSGKRLLSATLYDCQDKLPNYLNDLNAMHEAVAHLGPDEVDQFAIELSALVLENDLKAWWDLNPNEIAHVANATAAQRAEAFLKTLSLWRD